MSDMTRSAPPPSRLLATSRICGVRAAARAGWFAAELILAPRLAYACDGSRRAPSQYRRSICELSAKNAARYVFVYMAADKVMNA